MDRLEDLPHAALADALGDQVGAKPEFGPSAAELFRLVLGDHAAFDERRSDDGFVFGSRQFHDLQVLAFVEQSAAQERLPEVQLDRGFARCHLILNSHTNTPILTQRDESHASLRGAGEDDQTIGHAVACQRKGQHVTLMLQIARLLFANALQFFHGSIQMGIGSAIDQNRRIHIA